MAYSELDDLCIFKSPHGADDHLQQQTCGCFIDPKHSDFLLFSPSGDVSHIPLTTHLLFGSHEICVNVSSQS